MVSRNSIIDLLKLFVIEKQTLLLIKNNYHEQNSSN